MQLFKRVLLSLFPDELQQQHVNPAMMFISFVSAKQFFSVINRKIVENYKLNLFDVSLDSFEVKIGFGEKPAINMKQLDAYYGYCVAANLNGYRFFSPSMVGTNIALVCAALTYKSFIKLDVNYFRYFLITIVHFHYIFASRLKQLPHMDKEAQYNHFVELFFNFYRLTLKQHKIRHTVSDFATIKRLIIQEPHILMLIFSSLKSMGSYMKVSPKHDHNYFQWLFFDIHNEKKQFSSEAQQFLIHCDTSPFDKGFSRSEQKLLNTILPVDLIIKYLFLEENMFDIGEYILSQIFNQSALREELPKLVYDDDAIRRIYLIITDYKLRKNNYLKGIQQFITQFRLQHKNDQFDHNELDEFMSMIGEQGGIVDQNMIPESIRRESSIMENFMNFYITHVGGLRVARGDNGFMRITHRHLIDRILKIITPSQYEDATIQYFGGLLYMYNKSSFYYSHAYENIKAGKDRFHLPFKAHINHTYSHSYLLPHFLDSFVNILLQDLSPGDTRIYIKQKTIIGLFKKYFGQQIQQFSEMETGELLTAFYRPLEKVMNTEINFSQIIQGEMKDDIAITALKDRLYNLDMWIYHERCNDMGRFDHGTDILPTTILTGVVAMVKESLSGMLFLITYIRQDNKHMKGESESLLELYVHDVLQVKGRYGNAIIHTITEMFMRYEDILIPRLGIDDNRSFLAVATRSWRKVYKHIMGKKKVDIVGEDLVWLYSYLKTVHYYNIRYIIPR